ncbi:MAG: MarR family transcriptional regulator [Spongiibacteraceae bacterium]
MTQDSDSLSDLPKPVLESNDGPYYLEKFNSKDNMGYLIKRSYSALSNAIEQELAPHGLTYPQFVILLRLNEGDCSTAAELAREVCTDTGAMTRMLDRLECKELIRRVRSVEDRRVVNLEITKSGEDVFDTVMVIAVNVLNRYFRDFTKDEITLMHKLLRRVVNVQN